MADTYLMNGLRSDVHKDGGTPAFKARHPLVVLFWGFGILVAMNLPQYLGAKAGAMLGGLSFHSVISGAGGNLLSHLGQAVVAAIVGIPFGFLVIIILWRRPLCWLRLRFNKRLTTLGLILGLALPLVVMGVVSFVGSVSVTARPSRLSGSECALILTSALCWMSFIGFSEETVFRGIIVREWASRWGWKVAGFLGGLLFGVVHLPGVEGGLTLASCVWVLLAGVAFTLLCVALYVRGRSLWLPIGFHTGWNLCLQGILGVTISGKDPGYALFNMDVAGPSWLTGGTFGIEASLIATALYALTALFVLQPGQSKNRQFLNVRPV